MAWFSQWSGRQTVTYLRAMTLAGLCALHSSANAESLIPPHATVVLLVGLAGDVESENAYRDQLQSWLDVLGNSSTPPDQTFVLFDNPDTVAAPSSLAVNFRKATREEFLGLREAMGARTNPVTVIAWGHAGRQGRTPVFHVRGPRIAPADFKSFAAGWSQVEARFVLMFRGSGAFASQLASDKSEIISSEADTMFSSDPMGLSLVLKTVRANPEISVERLADELGRAVSAWYAGRQLARTEEPTLWLGKDKPRPLALAETSSSLSSAPAEAAGSTNKTGKSPAVPDVHIPTNWKGITRVEPQKFPEADAVILRQRISYTLGSAPAVSAEREEFIQILTAEGKSFGDFDIAFSPPDEDISFSDCEVLRADGKLVRLDPDAIREAREEAVGDYVTQRRKFFSLPGVVPGALLHVRYRSEWKKFPLPHISLEIPIGSEAPTVESALEVSVPKGAPFHFALDQFPAVDPAIRQGDYGTTYSWRLENVPANEREVLSSPRRQQPLLRISTFPDWASFSDWYARISQLADEVTPEIAAQAKELARDAKSDREKILALYNYVTSLRYVAVPLGVNSFRPHAAANVLQNQFGDCKDKANLFNTLLRSLNIQSHLVLVPRFSQAHETLPGFAFNHAISRVSLNGETIWVDTTDDVCRFGMLPPGDPGCKVLVIDGKTTALTQLPVPSAQDHRLELRGRVDCAHPAEPLPCSLGATAFGYPDYEMRATAREAKEHRASLPLLAARFRLAAGAFALEKQTSSSVAALGENFVWQADGTCVGLVSRVDGKLLLHAPFWLPKEWDFALHHRKTPLFLNQGYPLTLKEDFDFDLPANAQGVVLPAAGGNPAEPLKWSIQWAKSGNGALSARLRAEVSQGELTATQTTLFQKQLRDLLTALAASATLAQSP